ncbi:MAG TPA: response regulator transcription factor [Oscillospiraceae bacterium]|nr:response regulator transcription factor [Oscillospiraceae bacterium]HPF55913.1 response regulator transcription factor [Clostridiales bacterium]HPK35245.1 response regulator transcription factor [Oscillospiraceae bacterium]HPR75438.1 response regulator transcription factor [Oscillospiraceae bacterium]
MVYNILIVEDQPEISGVVAKYLDNEGYKTFVAKDGFEALKIFNKNEIHLTLLDVMMPGIDGFDVLKEIRKVSDTPVIMLTARTEEIDRLKGFDTGADDYVVKPFSVKEVVKRVNALIKRTYHNTDEIVFKFDNLSLHVKSMKLYKNEEEIPITAAEFELLHVLFKNRGQVLSREQLINSAYGFEYEGYDRNIDSAIKRLRQKIEHDPKNPKILLTKYGAGYVLGGV